jgi:uncharacterized protein (DUF342 family)
MFNKISLINKIEKVENKIDILLNRIESDTLFGCCDCKKRESVFCRELKNYVEDKMTQLEKDWNDKFANIDASLNCFTDILHGYKTDLVSNLEILSDHISKTPKDTNNNTLLTLQDMIEAIKQDQKMQYRKLLESVNLLSNMNKQMEMQVKKISELNTSTQKKLDVLFYENEIIKHQLLLEEEIRRYNDEIANIRYKLDKTLEDIDNIINKSNLKN